MGSGGIRQDFRSAKFGAISVGVRALLQRASVSGGVVGIHGVSCGRCMDLFDGMESYSEQAPRK